MQKLLMFNPDFQPFDATAVERALRSCREFTNLRLDEPGGALIECEYHEPDDGTIIRLSEDSTTISMYHTWGAALRAALLIQKSLKIPLRMVNDTYTFDLTFSDISSVEELEAAMDSARTS
jgi:hypothetical protein